MQTATAYLPLHSGKAPRWLFSRMVRLCREIMLVMAREFGPLETLRRLSDPYWFQGLLASYERQPEGFEALLGLPGVGPKTIRAGAKNLQP